MSTSVVVKESQDGWELPPTKPLDEAVWRRWIAKGRAQDRQSSAAYIKATKWISIAALLAAAALWSQVVPYVVVVRFIVSAGAIIVMFRSFHTRQYTRAAVCGALVLLYNPIAPAFTFSGDWQRGVVLASAVPFAVSLGWSK